jgi:hypothetical protein
MLEAQTRVTCRISEAMLLEERPGTQITRSWPSSCSISCFTFALVPPSTFRSTARSGLSPLSTSASTMPTASESSMITRSASTGLLAARPSSGAPQQRRAFGASSAGVSGGGVVCSDPAPPSCGAVDVSELAPCGRAFRDRDRPRARRVKCRRWGWAAAAATPRSPRASCAVLLAAG